MIFVASFVESVLFLPPFPTKLAIKLATKLMESGLLSVRTIIEWGLARAKQICSSPAISGRVHAGFRGGIAYSRIGCLGRD
jgi:hypothetical protein